MKKILLIHPEGNLNNNPNLYGIVSILSEKGYITDILSYHIIRRNQKPVKGMRGRIIKRNHRLVPISPVARLIAGKNKNIDSFFLRGFKKYDLVIGVDQGIIGASYLNKTFNIPHAYISYEIVFQDEVRKDEKKNEIEACRNVKFAICQDTVRANFLSVENKIPIDKIVCIPVAGKEVKREIKSNFLHKQLNIPENKKIALYMGSVLAWASIKFLIESAIEWDNDWVLVIHNRYGIDNSTKKYYQDFKDKRNIYFSTQTYDTPHDIKKMLSSADIGIAFYKPDYKTKFTGKNIKYIGMSSGKISTYFQYGIPVITNEIGEMSEHIRQYKLGKVIDDEKKFIIEFSQAELNNMRMNCFDFFEKYLDLNVKIKNLLERL